MTLSPEQIEQRLDGITATDIAAIIGQHPFRTPVQVWQEKLGQAQPFTGNTRTKWGHLLEPVIRADYEERHGVRVELCGTLEHPDRPWMKATPDGIVYQPGSTSPDRGLEIKTHTVRISGDYGTPGTDEVPAYELAQCMWGIATSGLQRWDLVAFIDGQPNEYVIDRDDELIGILVDRAERFLVDNVRGGVPPEPDGSASYSDFLKARWKTNDGTLIPIKGNTDDEQATFTMIEDGKALRETIAVAQDRLDKIEQALKAKIANRDGFTWKTAVGKDLKLTWKHSKEQRHVDVSALLTELRTSTALVASAKRADVERAIKTLRAVAGDAIGRSSQVAALTGSQLSELIATLHAALVETTSPALDAKHTRTFSKRPFCWPRSWKAPQEQ